MEMTMACAEESRAADEQLAGTFKPADTFFLIECNLPDYGGWAGETVKMAAKSGAFAPFLAHLQRAPRGKVLFIRRPQSTGMNFYIALTNQAQPRIYHTELSDYADLLSLEIAQLAEDETPHIKGRPLRQIDELYTVCTNGRHDPCCAAFGTPVYQALVAQVGSEAVWQTTHIGGHRMAATMIAFPQGIVYGHVDPLDAEAIVTNHRGGYLLPHKYRGRGAYHGHRLDVEAHFAVGAAEVIVREQTRKYRIDDLLLSDVMELGADERRITFRDGSGGHYSADVKTEMSAPRQTSCGEAPKPMPQHEVAVQAAL